MVLKMLVNLFQVTIIALSVSCEKPQPPKPDPVPVPTTPPVLLPTTDSAKYNLYLKGELRGANMYQQEKGSSAGQVWNPNITLQDLKDLRNASANFVNYSVPGVFDVNKYTKRNDFVTKLDTLIKYASDAGLYIIIAFRTGPGRGEYDITEDGINNKKVYTDANAQSAYIEMWKFIATKYKDNKYIAGYDLMVEPHDIDAAKWSTFAQKIVDAIRAIDGNMPIIVPAPDWSTVDGLKMMGNLKGNNLVYAVHQYESYEYSHNNKGNVDAAIKELNALYTSIYSWINLHRSPVIINEFGVANKVANGEKFIAAQLAKLDGAKISHAAWIWEVEYDKDYDYAEFDFKDKVAILNEYKKSWAKNTEFVK